MSRRIQTSASPARMMSQTSAATEPRKIRPSPAAASTTAPSDDGDDGIADPAQGSPVALRGADPEPDRAGDDRRDGSREDRLGHADGQQLDEPGPGGSDRPEAARQEVRTAPASVWAPTNAEPDAAPKVTPSSTSLNAGRRTRNSGPTSAMAAPRTGRATPRRMAPGRRRRQPRGQRDDVRRPETERAAGHHAPQDRRAEDREWLVLVDVDRVDVDDDEGGHDRGRDAQRDRVEPGEGQPADESDAERQPDPERAQVAARQAREQRGHEARAEDALVRGRGERSPSGAGALPAARPRRRGAVAWIGQRLTAPDAEPPDRDLDAAVPALDDVRFLRARSGAGPSGGAAPAGTAQPPPDEQRDQERRRSRR